MAMQATTETTQTFAPGESTSSVHKGGGPPDNAPHPSWLVAQDSQVGVVEEGVEEGVEEEVEEEGAHQEQQEEETQTNETMEQS